MRGGWDSYLLLPFSRRVKTDVARSQDARNASNLRPTCIRVYNNINLIVRSPNDKTFRSSRCCVVLPLYFLFSLPLPERRPRMNIQSNRGEVEIVTHFDLLRTEISALFVPRFFPTMERRGTRGSVQGLKRFIFETRGFLQNRFVDFYSLFSKQRDPLG